MIYLEGLLFNNSYKNIFGKKYFYFINKIKEMNKNDLNDEINPDDCENWMIKFNNKNIKINWLLKFTIYLNPNFLKFINGKTYFTFYELNVIEY